MANEIDKMSRESDRILLELFEKLEQRLQQWTQLEDLMKDGFYNISKARYSMGNKAVTSLQYPTEIEAIAQVVVETKDDNYEEFQIQRSKISVSQGERQDGDEQSSLTRRRNVLTSKDAEGVEEVTRNLDEVNISKKEKDKIEHISDPLNWFGILVPPCLRSAQKDFDKVIDICAEMATLQGNIYVLVEKFKDLKAQLLDGSKDEREILLSEEKPSEISKSKDLHCTDNSEKTD